MNNLLVQVGPGYTLLLWLLQSSQLPSFMLVIYRHLDFRELKTSKLFSDCQGMKNKVVSHCILNSKQWEHNRNNYLSDYYTSECNCMMPNIIFTNSFLNFASIMFYLHTDIDVLGWISHIKLTHFATKP